MGKPIPNQKVKFISYLRWMESTYLYYGKYHADNAGPYQMAVAYFFVIFCCYAISMIRIVMHSGKYFKQGFKFNELNSHQYFDLVFCYWDFSISSKDSVQIKQVICPLRIIFNGRLID